MIRLRQILVFLVSGKLILLYRIERRGEAFYTYAVNAHGSLATISDVLATTDNDGREVVVGLPADAGMGMCAGGIVDFDSEA